MAHDLMWHGLAVGDWATWLAGAATFGAVCAAIGVPWHQSYAARKAATDRANRVAQVMAIENAELFIRLRRDLIAKHAVIAQAELGHYDGNPAPFVLDAKVLGVAELPTGGDLHDLPYPVAPAIASLRSMLAMYNGSIDVVVGLVQSSRLKDAVEKTKLAGMRDGAQGALARAAGHLGKFDPSYRLLDYLDRGDGTQVTRLQDY